MCGPCRVRPYYGCVNLTRVRDLRPDQYLTLLTSGAVSERIVHKRIYFTQPFILNVCARFLFPSKDNLR